MSKLTRSRESEATKDLQSSKRQKVNEFDEDEDDKAIEDQKSIEKKSDAETVTGGEENPDLVHQDKPKSSAKKSKGKARKELFEFEEDLKAGRKTFAQKRLLEQMSETKSAEYCKNLLLQIDLINARVLKKRNEYDIQNKTSKGIVIKVARKAYKNDKEKFIESGKRDQNVKTDKEVEEIKKSDWHSFYRNRIRGTRNKIAS